MIKELVQLKNVVSCHPIYMINSGLELALTNEFVVKFKENVDSDKQLAINREYEVSVKKSTDLYQLLEVSKGANALEMAMYELRTGN